MNKPATSATAYPLAVIVTVAAMVLFGAMALSLIFTGDPAYPVKVFGLAGTRGNITAVRAIRPTDMTALPRGRVDPNELLPLPPPPPAWVDRNADPLYAQLARSGASLDLDRARTAAQTKNQAYSLRLYEKLTNSFPQNRALLLERTSVLASFGRHTEAAQVLLERMARFPDDAQLRVLAAHNLWWSGQALAADSVLGLALALQPGSEEALRLRETIRPTTQPDIVTAQRWVSENDGPVENLLLARAYAREERYGESLAPYQRAISPVETSDSLLLEVASAASAADSVQLLAQITRRYMTLRPDDTQALLRLAQAYSWRKDYTEAARLYDELIALSADPLMRLEKANVLVWAGREREAERELATFLEIQPRNPDGLKLLGDLAYYRGDWATALRHYRTVASLNPTFPGLVEAMARADEAAEQARLAALPRPQPDAYAFSFDIYSDNQNFSWLTAQALRTFRSGRSSLTVAAQQDVARNVLEAGTSVNPGYGAELQATLSPQERILVMLAAGVQTFDLVGTFPTWSAGVSFYDYLSVNTTVRYAHGPAGRRATSLLALQAETTSDLLQASVTKTAGPWTAWSQVEAERLDSRLGSTARLTGAASLTRSITPKLSAGLAVSAQTSNRAAPVLPGFGSLYWAPEYYVEPSLNVTYREAFGTRWAVTGGVSVGHGFVKERALDRRFAGGGAPTAGASLDVQYTSGAWAISVGGNYGGAMQQGYRSGTVRVQGSYFLRK